MGIVRYNARSPSRRGKHGGRAERSEASLVLYTVIAPPYVAVHVACPFLHREDISTSVINTPADIRICKIPVYTRMAFSVFIFAFTACKANADAARLSKPKKLSARLPKEGVAA
jgi:hypothetical protein